MNILITGMTGFVGGALAKKLRAQHKVSGLVRTEASSIKLKNQGFTTVLGDLMSVRPDSLTGCEVVIHCAAYVEEWGTENDFFETNVLGTKRLVAAAQAAGVKRFVFIGTEAAFFTGEDLVNIDESIQYPKYLPYPYSRSKAEAERIVLAANTAHFQTLSLRPRFVWGPGDKSVLPALIDMIHRNQFAWIGGGKFQISSTYIDNLVHAVEQVLTLGDGGEAFFIADDGEVDMREFLTAALHTQGVVAPSKTLPKPIARILARIVEMVWCALGIKRKPPLVRFSIDMMSANCTVNTAKAKSLLKYNPPVSRAEGLERMFMAQRKVRLGAGEREMPTRKLH
jgi:nucleoside-diphosphate-sugar epimerase